MFNIPGFGQISTTDGQHIRIGTTDFVLTARNEIKPGQWILSGEMAEGSKISMASLFARFSTEMHLPDEFANIDINQLTFEVSTATGGFSFTGSSNVQWTIPFAGISLPAGDIHVAVAREANGDGSILRTEISFTTTHDVTAFDGFTITGGSEIAFKWNPIPKDANEEPAPGNTWVVSGSFGAVILEADFQFDVAVAFTPEKRTFTLEGKRTSTEPLVAFEAIGSLDARSITIEVTRLQGNEEPAENAVKIDAQSQYTWSISADCGFTLEVPTHFSQQGTLSLTRDGDNIIFMFKATDSDLSIPLPIPEHDIAMHLAMNQLSVTRQRTAEQVRSSWTFEANPAMSFSDLPSWLDAIVDTVTGTFKVSSDGLTIGIERWIKPQSIPLPPITFADTNISLGTVVFDASNLVLNIGKTLDGSMDFGVGIPAELNTITGVDTHFFKVYEEGKEDSIVRGRLTIDETTGLSFKLLNSPLGFIADDPNMPGWSIADFGDFGAFRFMMPAFGYSGTAFNAQVGFEQIPDRPLQIPLTPFKLLMKEAHVDGLNALIPDAIPVEGPEFFDANGHPQLDAFITRLERVSGITLPDAIHEAINAISSVLEQLPQGLKDYLDFKVPTSFVVDIALSDAGGARVDFSTPDGNPLRLLTMAGTPLPSLVGIELHSFMLGEILTGALFTTEVDARIDIFDLVTLAAALALPLNDLPLISSVDQLQRRILIDKLFMLVVYETGIPLPIPLFFNELAVEYRGLEGAIFQSHFAFPMPKPNITEILTTFAQFRRFFTEHDYLLQTNDLPQDLDLRLTIGANYLQLPKYLGSKLLGTEQNYTYSLWETIAHVLNATKTLSIEEIVQAVPYDIRNNHEHIDMYGAGLDVTWLVTTPREFRESAYSKINVVQADVESTLQIIPRDTNADLPGLILFLHGNLDIQKAASLDMIFGLAATSAGLRTAFRSHGQIKDLIDVNWAGAFLIDPHGKPAFMLSSNFDLKVLDRVVLDGSVTVSDQMLAINGYLDLFPAGSPVDVTGNLSGNISSDALLITGDVDFSITKNFKLAAAHGTITQNGLMVDATLLGQTAHLSLQRDNDATVLYASMDEINIENVFTIDQTEVYINTAHGLRILGGIGVLGIHTHGELDYLDDHFHLLIEGNLFNVFDASVELNSALFDAGSNINAFVQMKSQFNTDLAQRVINYMQSKRDELNADLKAAQDEITRWSNELKRLDQQIADTRSSLNGAIQKDEQDLQNARNALDGYKSNVDQFKGQVDARRADIKRNNDDVDAHLASYIRAVNNAQSDVDSLQKQIDDAQNEYNAHKERLYLLAEIGTLKGSKLVADGVLDLAVKALQTASVGYDYISETADATLLGFEQSLKLAQDALDAQNLLIQGLEQNLVDLHKQLDDAIQSLGNLRNAADWSLTQAKQALSDFGQASGAVLNMLNQITDWSIGGLLAVHEAHFSGTLNLLSGGEVSLFVDLEVQGKNTQYSFDFNFYNLTDSAKQLADKIIHDITFASLPQPQF